MPPGELKRDSPANESVMDGISCERMVEREGAGGGWMEEGEGVCACVYVCVRVCAQMLSEFSSQI